MILIENYIIDKGTSDRVHLNGENYYKVGQGSSCLFRLERECFGDIKILKTAKTIFKDSDIMRQATQYLPQSSIGTWNAFIHDAILLRDAKKLEPSDGSFLGAYMPLEIPPCSGMEVGVLSRDDVLAGSDNFMWALRKGWGTKLRNVEGKVYVYQRRIREEVSPCPKEEAQPTSEDYFTLWIKSLLKLSNDDAEKWRRLHTTFCQFAHAILKGGS